MLAIAPEKCQVITTQEIVSNEVVDANTIGELIGYAYGMALVKFDAFNEPVELYDDEFKPYVAPVNDPACYSRDLFGKTSQALKREQTSLARLLGLVYDMPEHRMTTLDLYVRKDVTRKQLDRLTEAGHLQYVDYSESDFAIAFWQVSRVSARSILGVDPPIRYSDFIKARDCGLCIGIVFSVGEIQTGKTTTPGYWIKTASGKDDFISHDQAVLIG